MCVDLIRTFTGNDSRVDHSKHIYKEDPALRDFLKSPVAKHCRLRDHLLPLFEKFTVEEMIEFLNNPGPDITEATLALVKQMAAGGLVNEPSAAEQEDMREAKQKLLEFH